jgi:hypothetical protein
MQSTPNAIAPNYDPFRYKGDCQYKQLQTYLAKGLLTAFALFQKSDQQVSFIVRSEQGQLGRTLAEPRLPRCTRTRPQQRGEPVSGCHPILYPVSRF